MRKNLSQDSIRVIKPKKHRYPSDLYENEKEKLILNQPDLHLTGIILCLTLRKTFKAHLVKLEKFSFYLLRSLYIESKRPSKLPKYPKRISKSQTAKPDSVSFQAKSSIIQKVLKRSLKSHFISFKFSLNKSYLSRKVKSLKFIKSFQATQRSYFRLIVGPYPDYLKIVQTFEKFKIFKLISAFNTWLIHSQELKAKMLFDFTQLLLPPPVNIHDYIDDFFEVSKEKIEASYISYTSTQEFTSRLIYNKDY